jgi:hypothetical protein
MKNNPPHTMHLTDIDDNVAGVTLGEDGLVSLDKNPLPNYWEVKLDVKDRHPQSPEIRKQEVMASFQAGLLDEIELKILNWKENLNIPIGGRREFEAYRKAVYNNVVLFNDGVEPGNIDVNQIIDDPEIHLMAVREFTGRLEFSFAKKEIRAAFESWIGLLEDSLAGYPRQLPDILQQAASAEQPGGPGGGQGAPPAGGGAPPGGAPF